MSEGMKSFLIIIGMWAFIFIFGGLVYVHKKALAAQEPPKSWVLWEQKLDKNWFNNGGATLYKIQDGQCQVYVAWTDNPKDNAVSVATGQGCR